MLLWLHAVAVNKLPNFVADPNTSSSPLPHHQCTVHLNTENVALVHAGYVDALAGRWSTKYVLVMLAIQKRQNCYHQLFLVSY